MQPEIEATRAVLIERLMFSDASYDAGYERIVRLLKSVTGASAAAFTVLDGRYQFFKAQEGFRQRAPRRKVSFCSHTIEHNQPLIVGDALRDLRFASTPIVCAPDGYRAYAGVPVRGPNGLPIGTLCILDEQPRDFGEREKIMLADLAATLAELLILRGLSVVDPLTGLFNRRYFEQAVSREWTRGLASQRPVAVAMIDIDYFKKYNDSYGHAAGDACLRAVANALRTITRSSGDVLARIGGEEFVIVLPNTWPVGADQIATRIHGAIEALKLPHGGSPLGRLTASIGFAIVANTATESLESAMKRADDALYSAKAQGRDRMVVAAA